MMTQFSLPVLNKQSLAEKVELLVQKHGIRYSEAVIDVCEEYGIEATDMAKLIIDSPLKAKIEKQAIQFNTVKGKKQSSSSVTF